MSEIEELRAQLRKEQRKSTRKIARIREGTQVRRADKYLGHLHGRYGVDISGTRYDPRSSNIDRMTRAQLRAAIERNREFNSNVVNYFGGHSGGIVSATELRRLAWRTERYNQEVRAYNERVKDVPMPWVGDNITHGEYHDFVAPKTEFLEGTAHYSHRERRMPTPRAFKSDRDVKLKAKMLEDSLGERAHNIRLASVKDQIRQMIERIGDPTLYRVINDLTDDQLWFAWTANSELADALSLKYDSALADDEGIGSAAHRRMLKGLADKGDGDVEEIINGTKGLIIPPR